MRTKLQSRKFRLRYLVIHERLLLKCTLRGKVLRCKLHLTHSGSGSVRTVLNTAMDLKN
jgi:hypothetical protein